MASDELGVLITAPDGTIFNISMSDLEAFKVPPEKVDAVIQSAESAGLLQEYIPEEAPLEAFSPAPAESTGNTIINIFTNGSGEEQTAASGEPPRVASSMSKYAAGSTMSKYAAGSTMSKYAAGSTMSKYAAGSTMSKYAAGSTLGAAQDPIPIATFYGKWVRQGD